MIKRTGRNRTDSGPSLGGKRGQVLKDLCLGTPIRAAAKAAGVSPNTIYTWLKEPAFRLALDEARRAGFFNAKDLIKLLAENAVAVLSKTMNSDDPAQSRLAATTILDRALALEQREDFENRLAEIEKIVGIRPPALRAAEPEDREPS